MGGAFNEFAVSEHAEEVLPRRLVPSPNSLGTRLYTNVHTEEFNLPVTVSLIPLAIAIRLGNIHQVIHYYISM